MRIKKCSFRYLGHDEGVLPTVHRGTILTTESIPKKATLLEYSEERRRMVPVDSLTKVEISGEGEKLILSGVSGIASNAPYDFGPDYRVRVEVTPTPGCKNCG